MPTLINPSAVVNGESLNTQELLKLKHRIPEYQRDYVWTNKVIEQLWDDLFEHYKKYANQEKLINPEGYFLGAMVVIVEGNGVYEVVDGQQRLTSLTIIMSVLLDYIEKLNVDEPYRSGYEQVAKECLGQFVGGDWESNLRFSDTDMARFFLGSCLTSKTYDKKKEFWEDASITLLLLRKKSAFYKVREAIEVGYVKLDEFLGELTDKANRI